MTLRILAIAMFALAPAVRAQENCADASDKALCAEFLAVEAEDQAAMGRAGELYAAGKPWEAEMRAVQRKHAERLKAVQKEKGWPGPALLGIEGFKAATVVVQHADHDPALQKKFLKEMKKRAGKKDGVSADLYARLEDRLLMNARKVQRYGTHLEVRKGQGCLLAAPLERPGKTEALRRKLGLEPLSEYLEVCTRAVLADPENCPGPKCLGGAPRK